MANRQEMFTDHQGNTPGDHGARQPHPTMRMGWGQVQLSGDRALSPQKGNRSFHRTQQPQGWVSAQETRGPVST